MNKELQEKRKEYNILRSTLYSDKGMTCVNCGSTESLTFHHIVPLAQGGTNRLSNIAVLCYACHKAVHGEREARKYTLKSLGGRRPTAIDEELLDKYFCCEITRDDVEATLTKPGGKGSKIYGFPAYREYIARHRIVEFRNNLAMKTCRGRVPKAGDVVGYIRHEGENDRTYITWRGDNEVIAHG